MASNEERTMQAAELQFDASCPSCHASIEFNPEVGKLKCPYCGYEADIPAPENEQEQVAQELDFHSAEARGNVDWGTDTKNIICQECGAESIYDALQVADTCPYCGSNQVMESAGKDTLAPNGVCTFEVTHRQAAEHFEKWIGGKWFTPRAAKESAQPDAFQGVYLPYWTFDTKTSSRYSAKYGRYRDTKDKDGNVKRETDWFNCTGLYQQFFDDHLVCATTRYEKGMLKQIEPFHMDKNKAYRPEYMSGYLAERYSVGLDDGWEIAQTEIGQSLRQKITEQIKETYDADTVKELKISTTHDDVTYKYLTLPVWLSSFKYDNKIYSFMVNGQTGKVAGEAPTSKLRVTIAIVIVLLIIAAIWLMLQ